MTKCYRSIPWNILIEQVCQQEKCKKCAHIKKLSKRNIPKRKKTGICKK